MCAAVAKSEMIFEFIRKDKMKAKQKREEEEEGAER